MGPPKDGWDAVAPNVEFQHAEDEGVVQERELPQEDQLRNVDLPPELSGNRSELHVHFTAELKTAAFGIEGMILHSALGFNCGHKTSTQYQSTGCEKLHMLCSRLSKLKLLIIDEVSMAGAIDYIHHRLQDICRNSDPDS
ncbi:Hypothetical predicted protein [Octopus vulgaris]|uniref:DNA helicase n=1 Tax=Octopus vulgaris TaxID=6645 RepID=A0AA36AK05_OCTVU|nr:Hypothetical predicted protein [Octopus vulgaris]